MQQRLGYYSLEMLYHTGSREVEFRCFRCKWRRVAKIENLMGKYGPAMELYDLARRATCTKCGRDSCWVQVVPPPAPGEPGHEEYMRHAVKRYEDWLGYARRFR
ncbi:hypothetical protein ABMY26_31420 [Azospirillum sp. HJ39]|uniref:hypothetical protein n=1 Tax=Azospirillum sp. HJ39 TaxID=3159496 RepID=UPI003558779A